MKHIISIFIAILSTAAIATAQNYRIGDLITNPDGSQGIVFYVNKDRTNGWMVALDDLSTHNWGNTNEIAQIPNIDNPNGLLKDEDGYTYTGIIRDINSNYPNTYGAGQVDYDNGWYIPTAGQLMKLCSVLDKVNTRLAQAGGSYLLKQSYFSCSESDTPSKVWTVNFGSNSHDWGGQFETHSKNETAYFRAVRNIHSDCLPQHYDLNISACQNYKWNDMVYTESGDYTHTFTDQNGCDSIVTLHLTIAETIYNTISQSTCEEYEWNGITYTEPGSYQQSFTTADGCDSIVTLNLSFDGIIEMTHEFTSCDSFTYHGETYEQSGVYSQLVPGSAGCDTLATLRLHIITTPHGTIEGPIQVYAATDLVTGLYNYHIDLQSQPYTSVTWLIDNEQWLLYPDGDNCQVYVTTPYSATLTAIVEYKGCISECTLTISATYFDVEEQEGIFVSIYPNPANGSINLACEGIEEVRIYNLLGQNVLSQQGDGCNIIQISTSDLDAAIYLMEISTQRGKTVKRVAIIK